MAQVSDGAYRKIDGMLCEIKRQLRQKNGYPHDLGALQARLQDIVRGDLVKPEIQPLVTSGKVWEFKRDRTLTAKELYERAGEADVFDTWHHELLKAIENRNETAEGIVTLHTRLVPIADKTRGEVEAALKKAGYRPATFEEFLCFITEHKDELKPRIRIACLDGLKGTNWRYEGIVGYVNLLVSTIGRYPAKTTRSLTPYPYTTLQRDVHTVCLAVEIE